MRINAELVPILIFDNVALVQSLSLFHMHMHHKHRIVRYSFNSAKMLTCNNFSTFTILYHKLSWFMSMLSVCVFFSLHSSHCLFASFLARVQYKRSTGCCWINNSHRDTQALLPLRWLLAKALTCVFFFFFWVFFFTMALCEPQLTVLFR